MLYYPTTCSPVDHIRQEDELIHIEDTFRSEFFKFDHEQVLIVTAQEKECTGCGRVKPIEEFSLQRDSYRKTGRRSQCKECVKINRHLTPEQREEQRKKRIEQKKSQFESLELEAYSAEEKKKKSIRRMRLKRYGLNEDEYEHMLRSQKGLCALCGNQPNQGKKLVIDHDHRTGMVRGLLCSKCNIGLGSFKDDISCLKDAIAYLQRFA